MPKTLKFESLRGNIEFKKILSAKKVSSDLFTIYYTNKGASPETNKIHMSFVSAKKLGNAVKRNKIRRRLKMAAIILFTIFYGVLYATIPNVEQKLARNSKSKRQ